MNKIKLMLGVMLFALCISTQSIHAKTSQNVWDKMTPWQGDKETEEQRKERLAMIDLSIEHAVERATCDKGDKDCQPTWRGTKEDLRWLLIGQAYFETHLARHVHADECRAKLGECDSGRAKSLWQIQQTAVVKRPEWESLGGITQENTDNAAWAATRILSLSYNHCKSLSGAISLYATGKTCFWGDSSKRMSWIRRARKHYSPRYGH